MKLREFVAAVLVAAGMMFLAIAQATPAEAAQEKPPKCVEYRTVQKGDNYWDLAYKLGMDSKRLEALNTDDQGNVKDLQPGVEICVSIVKVKNLTGRVAMRVPFIPAAKEYEITIRGDNGVLYTGRVSRWYWIRQRVQFELNGAGRIVSVK